MLLKKKSLLEKFKIAMEFPTKYFPLKMSHYDSDIIFLLIVSNIITDRKNYYG